MATSVFVEMELASGASAGSGYGVRVGSRVGGGTCRDNRRRSAERLLPWPEGHLRSLVAGKRVLLARAYILDLTFPPQRGCAAIMTGPLNELVNS